jgi:hypothetical protein
MRIIGRIRVENEGDALKGGWRIGRAARRRCFCHIARRKITSSEFIPEEMP